MRQHVNIALRETGKIFHRQPNSLDGPCLEISSTGGATGNTVARFLQAAWHPRQECVLIGDHLGNIYKLDLDNNKYNLAKRCGMSVTSLAFAPKRTEEILAATSDYSMHCYNTETGEDVAQMRGHKSSIRDISIHAGGRYAITWSVELAQLWDLDTYSRTRKLSMKRNVDIVKAFFLPKSNVIITCFKDDSIFAWEADTLTCKYQLHVTEGPAPNFTTFAASRDGRVLLAGGKSRFLHLWSLESRELIRVIELPRGVKTVRSLEFFPSRPEVVDGQVVGVLDGEGSCRFLHIGSCRQLFAVGGGTTKLTQVSVSCSGRHLVAVTEEGAVQLYDVKALCAELQKPPPPLVAVVPAKQKPRRDRNNNTATSGSSEPGRPYVAKERLIKVLRGYGVYPDKYRLFIWRTLLGLPENHAAFGALVDKGTHPAHENINHHFPIKSQKLLRVLRRVLSALANWSPLFGESDFVPHLAFPFIKLSQNNQLIAFELVATVLVNWASHWFEYFPNPPINVLAMVENVLAFHDKELLQHFITNDVTSQIYAWPLLQSLFSEVLTADEWLRVMDHVFSNHPGFLLLLVAAYCVTSRGALLRASEKDDFQYFFRHRNAIDLNAMIKEAYRMADVTTPDISPLTQLEAMDPLPRGQYPIFNKYPKFIVDYQVQERERIRQEEISYLRQRQSTLAVERETRRRQEAEAAWVRQQQLLVDAEEKRRRIIKDEDDKMAHQRVRLKAMEREMKLKELQLLDATRAQFAQLQQARQAARVQRLDDELDRKLRRRDEETDHAVEDMNLKNMELHLQRNLLQQELEREAMTAQQLADNQGRVADDLGLPADIGPLERAPATNLHQLDRMTSEHVIPPPLPGVRHTHSQPHVSFHSTEDSASQRMDTLESECTTTIDRISRLQSQQERTKERLENLRQRVDHHRSTSPGRDLEEQFEGLPVTSDPPHRAVLNDSASESSLQWSLDRGRTRFEDDSRQLMEEVRALRRRLVESSRHRPPESAAHA